MACESEYSAWQDANTSFEESVATREQSRTAYEEAQAATQAAAEALATAQQTEASALQQYTDDDEAVGENATVASETYTAWLNCVTGGGDPLPEGTTEVIMRYVKRGVA